MNNYSLNTSIVFYVQTFWINHLINYLLMKGFGFRNSNASKTSIQKQELGTYIRQAELLWFQETKEESLNLLRKAIDLLKLIAQNESVESSKIIYEKKLTELMERLKNREEGKDAAKKISKEEAEINEKVKKRVSQAIIIQRPNIKFQDVAGLETAKNILKEQIILPIKFKEIFTGNRRPCRGILLYGAKGTGKTFLARACSAQIEGTFFVFSSSDLMRKQVGQSEKFIKALFKQAKAKKPSVIFIDDLESIFNQGEQENQLSQKIRAELFDQMQNAYRQQESVLIFASTNAPWRLDRRFRRMFQRRTYIPLPQYKDRLDIIKRILQDMKGCIHTLTKVDLEDFAQQLKATLADTLYQPIRRFQKDKIYLKSQNGKWKPCGDQQEGESKIRMDFKDLSEMKMQATTRMDFMNVLKRSKPTVSQKSLLQFQQYFEVYGLEA